MAAIIGQQSITLDNGQVLHASTDLDLARQWARYEVGESQWSQLRPFDKYAYIADALGALREAYDNG